MDNSDSNNNKKKLPKNIQSFQKLIRENYLYADKTRLIHKIVTSDDCQFFLARPRRFGKSLLLSAFAELFRGEKELFKDAWIGSSGYEFPQHPVIHLDMMGDSYSPEKLEMNISGKINKIAQQENLILSDFTGIANYFDNIIQELYKKYNKKIVLLIDEYDNPISSNIDDPTLVQKNLKVLSDFFSPIKPNENLIRFVFITGVTRFTLAGLSSSLNQLTDLTLNSEFANLCGFGVHEFDGLFADRLPETLVKLKSEYGDGYAASFSENDLREKILNHYDGYSWDGKTMALNPYSIIRFFDEAALDNYWVETGSSLPFIEKLVKNNTLKMVTELRQGISRTNLVKMQFHNLQTLPLLFQTGYLTVDRINITDSGRFYFFKIPNLEIKSQFDELFDDIFNSISSETPAIARENFLKTLKEGDEAGFAKIVENIFAGLVAEHHRGDESFYHSGLYCYCFKLADDARMEEPGSEGDLDLFLVFGNKLFVVIELKYEKENIQNVNTERKIKSILSRKANLAIKSIIKKRYGAKYERKGSKIIDVGLGVYGRGRVLAKISERVF